MSQITIVRTNKPWPLAAIILDAIKDFLFGVIDGFNRDDKRAWRRIWMRIKGMEAGELLVVDIRMPRSGPYHRRHMAIEQAVFDAQDRFSNFKAFRDWVKIGSAHCDWVPGPKGAVVPIPKSISYSAMDDAEFRVFHESMIAFLRGDRAAEVLWPHLNGKKAVEMMESILREFSE